MEWDRPTPRSRSCRTGSPNGGANAQFQIAALDDLEPQRAPACPQGIQQQLDRTAVGECDDSLVLTRCGRGRIGFRYRRPDDPDAVLCADLVPPGGVLGGQLPVREAAFPGWCAHLAVEIEEPARQAQRQEPRRPGTGDAKRVWHVAREMDEAP